MKTDVKQVGKLLLFIGLLGLWSCEKETVPLKTTTLDVPTIGQARSTFLNLQYNIRSRSKSIPLDGKIRWNASEAKHFTEQLAMLYTPVKLESDHAKSFLASVRSKENVYNRVFTVLYGASHTDTHFDGVILIHNNQGDFIKAYEYIEGKRVKAYLAKNKNATTRGRGTSDCSLTLEDIRIIVETFGVGGLSNLIPCLSIEADLDDGSDSSGGGDSNSNNGNGNPLDVPIDDLDDNNTPGGGSTGNNNPWWDNNKKCKEGEIKNSKGECVCDKGRVKDLNGKCVLKHDPCKTIKTSMSNPNRKAQIQELSKKLGQKKEAGYKQNKDGTYTKLKTKRNGHSLEIPIDSRTMGYIHTHVNDFKTGKLDKYGNEEIKMPIKTFSPSDILQYLAIVRNAKPNGIPVHLTYGTVISNKGIYTLKYTGDPKDIGNNFKTKEEYKKIYKKYIKEGGIEKGLLKFLKDKIKVKNLVLYKVKENGKAKKKTLSSNGKVKTTNC